MTPLHQARNRRSPRFSIKPICFAACLAAQSLVMALPQGATPTFGQTQVKQTAPGQLAITQTTGKAGIDWQSFSIGAGERVVIQQPNASSVLLNRVTGYDPSLILGQMQANGRVFLTNPRGVIFGAGSQVDVGGLVATTLGISNEAVQSGRYQLLSGSTAPGSIVAGGTIHASGTVALVAPIVEQTGSIVAGRVGLAAASSVLVDVDGDGLIFFNARNDGLDARLSVLGTIQAQGGTADIRAVARSGFADTVLNLEGVVQAHGLASKGGRIVIDGGPAGVTRVAGRVDADGSQGGSVQVRGENVLIDSSARVSADGSSGGGQVSIGGEYQGRAGEFVNAKQVVVQAGAVVSADATGSGNGGQVIVWSDDATRFAGAANARGGATSGNGGLVEVSSSGYLAYVGSSDRLAPHGTNGTLLLDPSILNINASGPNADGTGTNKDLADFSNNILFATPNNATSIITAAQVATAVGNGSVTLQAKNTLNVNAAITVTNLSGSNSASTLTLQSGGDVNISAPISLSGAIHNLAISANDAGGTVSTTGHVVMSGTAAININGALTLTGSATPHDLLGNITAASMTIPGAVNLTGPTLLTLTGASSIGGALTGTVAGPLEKAGAGVLTLAVANPGSFEPITVSGGALQVGTSTSLGSSLLTLDGGTLVAGANNLSITNTILLGAGGGTIDTNGQTTTTLAGTASGAGSFTKQGLGTLAIGLAGKITSPSISITGGALATTATATDAIVDTAAVNVGSSATLTLNSNETIDTLTLAGTVGGTGTLTATTSAALNGGTVNTALNTATLTSAGTSAINAAASATTSATVTGGALTIGLAGKLSSPNISITGGSLATTATATDAIVDTAAVNVGSSGTLTLNSNETIDTLALAGILGGTGALTATTSAALTGGTANAAIATATFTSSGTSVINQDVTATTSANVTGGTLAFGGGAAGKLTASTIGISGGAVVDIDTAARLVTPALTLDGGTLRMTAAGLTLGAFAVGSGGATVDTNNNATALGGAVTGTGSFTKSGAQTLSVGAGGSITTPTIVVAGGTLATTVADRLGNGSAVQVTNGSTLSLGASNTVASLALTDGSLSGAGILTATTITSAGVSAIDTGVTATTSATVTGGTLTIGLAGKITAPTVAINGGALATTATATDAIADTAAVNVGTSGTLTLNSNETIGTLGLSGTLGGTGTLTATTSATLTGGTVATALNTPTLSSSGLSAINATATATSATVTGGTLTIGSTGLLNSNTIAVTGGTLATTAGSINEIANGAAVSVSAGATLDIANTEAITSLALSGTLSGAGALTASTSAALTGGTVNATLSTPTLTSSGAAAINAGVGATTSVTVSGGTLTIGSTGLLTTPAVNVTGGTLATSAGSTDEISNGAAVSVSNGATFLVGNTETITSLALAGTLSGAGALTASTSAALIGGVVGAALTTPLLTSSGTSSITANVSATTSATVTGGTLTIGPVGLLSSPLISIDAGTLATSGNESLGDGSALQVANSATLRLGGDETIASLANKTAQSPDGTAAVTLDGHTLTVAGAGATSFGGVIANGTSKGNLTKTGAGTLTLTGANTFTGLTSIQGGTLATSGLPNRLAPTGSIEIAAGSLLLGSAQTTDMLIVSGTFGGSSLLTVTDSVALVGGTLNGAISAPLLTSSGASSITAGVSATTSATVTSGTLTIGSAGTLTSPSIFVNGGTLATAAAERIGNSSGVTVASSGTLQLGGAETINTLTLAGQLAGPGALTATTSAALTGGTVGTALSTGTLTSSGASTINAAVLAGTQANVLGGTLTVSGTGTLAVSSTSPIGSQLIGIANGATLQTGAAERLGNGSALQVAAGGTLRLGGAETISTLALSGLLAGPGALTATTSAALDGGSVTTHLTTPTLTSDGISSITARVDATTGTTLIGGTLTIGAGGQLVSPAIDANGGTLVAGAGAQIDPASVLRIGTGATLDLAGNQTVSTLTLRGTLGGPGGLTASTSAALIGGTLNAALTTPTLTTSGTSTASTAMNVGTATVLNGSFTLNPGAVLKTPSLNVAAGSLVTTGAGQLAGTGAVQIATGASLQLGAAETVASLALTGQLGGAGSLNVSGNSALTDGVVGTTLSTATLTSNGASQINAGVTATTSATVQSGSLTITAGSLTSPLIDVQAGSLVTTASSQLGSSSNMNVASGASLRLAGAESIGAFTLGGSLDGTGSLLATSAALDGGTVNSTLGANSLTSTGASTLHAATSATGTATVTGGTLTVAADGSLAAPIISVQGGTLATASDERIADSAVLQVGNGGTLVLGGSETVASLANVTGQTVDGSAAVQLGTHVLTVRNLTAATDTTFGGVISGTGADALVKEGAGTLRLAGANTYTGTTLVNAGTLATVGNERLADAGAVLIANGATFALGGSETVASIADKPGQAADGSAQIQLGTHLLTVASTDATTDTTFTGVISGTGADALTKTGAGTLRLAGANTYSGTTLVAAGTLATVGSERLADTSALQVANGATLQLGGNETVASISDQAGQTADGTASIALGANALTVKSLAATTDTTFGGVISGTGLNGLTKDGAGTLRLAGANTYSGITLVNAGTLATIGNERLADSSAVQVANGARLAVGGNETVAFIADKTGQTADASAVIDVAASLTSGGAADTTYSGTITGAGALAKSGTGALILTGNNSYAGTTTIAAGTLQIGSGGTTGSLGTGAVTDNATLRFVRSDGVTVANAIGGSGTLEQAGSGTLTLSSPANSYAGTTTITSGTLATAGSNQLPDASAVIVKPAAALVLGGDETVASIQSDGTVTLNGSVTTPGNQTYTGAVIVATAQPITLTALNLDAQAAGNLWGTQPLSLKIGNELKLSSGEQSANVFRDLSLGTVSVGGGASIVDAGLLALSGDFSLLGGTFTLTAHAAPASYALVVEEGKVLGSILGPDGRTPVAEASDVITQTGGAITTAAGSSLAFLSPNSGSMTFSNVANNFQGSLSAVSGTAGTPWKALSTPPITGAPANVPGGVANGLSRITVAGDSIRVGPAATAQRSGLEADLVRISANTLSTVDGGTIVARLPYNDGLGGGTNASTPGLRITLLPGAFTGTLPFGNPTVGIATRVGDLTDGPISGIFSAGFVQVLPVAGRQGDTSVFLTGPTVSLSTSGYRFFNDGAGVLTEIPVYYNGFSPDTPQKSGALSAAASVSEEARRQRFEEAVRTENVAVRLRSGVIAEVGPGRPATVGSDGVKPPASCSPKEGELRCADAPPKTKVSSVVDTLREVVGR